MKIEPKTTHEVKPKKIISQAQSVNASSNKYLSVNSANQKSQIYRSSLSKYKQNDKKLQREITGSDIVENLRKIYEKRYKKKYPFEKSQYH